MMKKFRSTLRKPIWQLYLFLVLSSVLLLSAVVYLKWTDIEKWSIKEQTYLHNLITRSANDRFSQQEAMLKMLGERLLEIGIFEDREKAKALLDIFLKENPVFVAYGLTDPRGNFILTSSNLRGTLPNLLTSPASAESFKEAMETDGLSLGRTYLFKPLKAWVIPLRYAIRNAKGNVVAVITAGIALDGPFNPWEHSDLSGNFNVIVIKDADENDDIYYQYVNPTAVEIQRKEYYDKPMPDWILTAVKKRVRDSYGMDMKKAFSSDRLVYYHFDNPLLHGKVFQAVSFDPKLRIYTIVARKDSLTAAEFDAALYLYLIVFVLFNLLLFALFFTIVRLQKRSEKILSHQAMHDQLTDLPNRYYLTKNFERWREEKSHSHVLFFLDLDNFKLINDHFGHLTGDRVLAKISERLKSCCGDDTMLVRHGGDEFIILAPYTTETQTNDFIEHCLYQLRESIHLGTKEFSVTASIGAVYSTGNDFTLEELLIKADLAMYVAKKERNTLVCFSNYMQEENSQLEQIAMKLPEAIKNGELHMVYHPQLDASGGRVVGVEALIRWYSPTLGIVPPDRFIPVAEDSGLINVIGDYAIDTAFREIAHLQSDAGPLRLSINVSTRQLLNEKFRTYLHHKTAEYRLKTSNIVIEVTESLFIEDIDKISGLLGLLQNDGYQISLDDFGTGYSSLNILAKLPINELKIDKSFVRDIMDDAHDRALIQSIVGIAKSLDLPCLAEGVEKAEQVRLLNAFGCNLFQGYYFAQPMTAETLDTFLSEIDPSVFATLAAGAKD
jgi:diguanylate cyclase (GGDEF)-like protein